MRRGLALGVLVAALMLPTSMQAHGGKPHIMGTVSAVDTNHVEVKTSDGKTVSVHLSKDSKYLKGTAAATLEDVKVGLRVVLHVKGEGKDLVALEVRLPSGQLSGP